MTNSVEQTHEALRQQQNDNPLVTEENVFSVMEDAMDSECPRDAHGCKACERRGLPILPLRRGTTAAQLSSAEWNERHSAFDQRPGGNAAALLPLREAIERAAPQRRVLRQGYLYVYLQRRGQPNAQKVVQAYQVTEQGHFRSINPYNMRRGRPAPLPAKCTAANHDIPAAFITVDDLRFNRAWLAFANDCWPAKVINDYKAGQQFDTRFMALDIDALKQGNNQTAYGGMLRENDVSFLDNVLEYSVDERSVIFSLFPFYRRLLRKEPTKNFVNSTVAAYQRAGRPVAGVAAVVVPDPVGEVLETNYLRNALILDRKKWNSAEQRLYKYATSVEIAKIREDKATEIKRDRAAYKVRQTVYGFSGSPSATDAQYAGAEAIAMALSSEEGVRESWPNIRRNNRRLAEYESFDDAVSEYMQEETISAADYQGIDQRAGEYYDIAQRRTFNASYAAWSNRFISTINKITRTYVDAFRAEGFQRVAQYDYTDDDVTKADHRVSATSFMRMVARCLDGGPSDLAQYDEGKTDLSLGPLVYKDRQDTPSVLLWQELLGSYDSLFAKALFRRAPGIGALLIDGVEQEQAAQKVYEDLLDRVSSQPYSQGIQAQLDEASKTALLDQAKVMHRVVAGIVTATDTYKKWQEDASLKRIRQALSVAANSAMADIETLNEAQARTVELERTRRNANQQAADARKASADAQQKLQEAQEAQRVADEKAQQAQEATQTQRADAKGLQNEATQAQERATRLSDQANTAQGDAQKAQERANEANRTRTQAADELEQARARQREADQVLAREQARARNTGIGVDPTPPRTGKANNMLRYSVLLYENKAVTEAMVITSTDDLKKVYRQLEDFLARIHEGHGGKLPAKGRWWWRLTNSTWIKWRFFTEVSIPARYLPAGIDALAPEARAAAVQQAIAQYKADAGNNEFAGSSNLSKEQTNAQASNKHRRTVFRMLAPTAYGQQGSAGGGSAADEATENGAGTRADNAGSVDTSAQEEAVTQARERAEAANAELERAQTEADAARREAVAKAEDARILNNRAGASEAQRARTVEAVKSSAELLAEKEAALAEANRQAEAARAEVSRAQGNVDAATQGADGAQAQQRRAEADAARNRRQGAIGQAGDTINSAKLGATLDIVSIILLWQSLNNACKAIDNSGSSNEQAMAYLGFFSASIGIASSAMTLTGGTIEGVLAYRQPLTLGTNTAAYTLAKNLTRNGLILGAVTNSLDAFSALAKASNAMKRGDNAQVAYYYNLAAVCSVTAAAGSVMLLAGSLSVAVPVIGGVVALVAGTAAAIFAMVAESKRTKPLEAWMKRSVFGVGRPPQRMVPGFVYKWDQYEHMNSAFQALKAAKMGLWPQMTVTSGPVCLYEKNDDGLLMEFLSSSGFYMIQGVVIECECKLPQIPNYKERAVMSYALEVHLSGTGPDGDSNRLMIIDGASQPYDLFHGAAATADRQSTIGVDQGGRGRVITIVPSDQRMDMFHNSSTPVRDERFVPLSLIRAETGKLPSPDNRPCTKVYGGDSKVPGETLGVNRAQLNWITQNLGPGGDERPSYYYVYDNLMKPSSLDGIHSHVVLDTDVENIRFVSVGLRYWPDRNDPDEYGEINLAEMCSV